MRLFTKNLTIFFQGMFGLRNHDIPSNSGGGKIFGFNGIKLTNTDTGEMHFLGFALADHISQETSLFVINIYIYGMLIIVI